VVVAAVADQADPVKVVSAMGERVQADHISDPAIIAVCLKPTGRKLEASIP
jgi:hypothetical protein